MHRNRFRKAPAKGRFAAYTLIVWLSQPLLLLMGELRCPTGWHDGNATGTAVTDAHSATFLTDAHSLFGWTTKKPAKAESVAIATASGGHGQPSLHFEADDLANMAFVATLTRRPDMKITLESQKGLCTGCMSPATQVRTLACACACACACLYACVLAAHTAREHKLQQTYTRAHFDTHQQTPPTPSTAVQRTQHTNAYRHACSLKSSWRIG